jgi:hypothetical protein
MISLDDQLQHLPGQILLSLALNENADPRGRKAAVDIMFTKGYPEVLHKDLAGILAEVKADHEARHEIIEIVEQATESPQHLGASVAGVTTRTLNG